MELRFLGAATTVTGSQFLLTTKRAKVLIDCGMFQGNPHEVMHNRIPPDYDPSTIDALLLTHAHLDHCGLIPLVAARGMRAPIFATAGTVELAGLVLLDSGKLQEEFAERADDDPPSALHRRAGAELAPLLSRDRLRRADRRRAGSEGDVLRRRTHPRVGDDPRRRKRRRRHAGSRHRV